MVMSEAQSAAASLWVAHTWVYERFQHTPRLNVLSAEKQSGKSTLMDLLNSLCRNPKKADQISAAVLPRLVESGGRLTLLIDEADTYVSGDEALRGILNSGFEASGRKIISARTGPNGEWEPQEFATFCAVGLAGIGLLPSTIADRSVPIALRRKLPSESVTKLRMHRAGVKQLGEALAAWAEATDLSPHSEPEMPDGFSDRQEDISVPLLAIADHAGGAWPQRTRSALLELFTAEANREATGSDGVTLLGDIRAIFEAEKADRMFSAAICEKLGEMEDRPWPEYHRGQCITPVRLASVLKSYQIAPENFRDRDVVKKGYARSAFKDAWERYLPPLGKEAPGAEEG